MARTMLAIIKSEFHLRVIEESLARIERCLDLLTNEELWYKHNGKTNSVANLILHLEGNIRQYILSGLGDQPDIRERDLEFKSDHNYSSEELLEKLTTTLYDADAIVSNMTTEDMEKALNIQGFQHTGLSAVVHVIEHLSYHVGQITYYTKYIKNVDTAYYGGLDLDVTGN